MATVWLCIGVAALAFASGVAGLFLQKLLPEPHTSDRSREMIGAIVGLVSLLLALVLGTLVGSSYAFYATQKSELETFAARSLQLDLALAEFGPETAPPRAQMKEVLTTVREMLWGESSAPDLTVAEPIEHLRFMDEYAASLDPKTPAQRQFASAAVADAGAIEQTRLLISLQLASPVSWPLVVNCRVLGVDPFLRVRAPLPHQRHHARRSGLRCFRGGQRVVLDSRAEPTLHRRFSGAVRRLRSDAGVVGQIEAPHAA